MKLKMLGACVTPLSALVLFVKGVGFFCSSI